jgi:predicted short-subunit dehydrogenase-like oxidoreductase (DUF2520 family)
MKKLAIIGCGKVGKTLARLWAKNAVFEIADVLNRSRQSSAEAVDFIQAGRPVADFREMNGADVFLIGTSDAQILPSCEALATSGLLQPGNIVFQCSGAIPSASLDAAKQAGAFVASVHPVKSFTAPEICVETFAGTFCGTEGDDRAISVLGRAFGAIGGRIFKIDPEYKTIYHSALVLVCNYLTALLEVGITAYSKAGLERETALKVMEPLVRETVDNIFEFGTVQALTGPIARGDDQVVAQQLAALSEWDQLIGNIYRDLGTVTLKLSRAQGSASAESLAALSELLEQS